MKEQAGEYCPIAAGEKVQEKYQRRLQNGEQNATFRFLSSGVSPTASLVVKLAIRPQKACDNYKWARMAS